MKTVISLALGVALGCEIVNNVIAPVFGWTRINSYDRLKGWLWHKFIA